ncbi:hypothetical protein NCAS_0A09270 [Naumovozyma castellii]|uniref:Spindle pole body component SPC42 n=1 Tax=Naumovozyma castellii TaxID=27288 RepID=G0V7N7_NAUCA|nr:hypothetical protein NCAS_0A09270 [Naumovozyma castellii CBS 4309]CCC67485.1 hypothetical protein NCAS_0A09270 [Naumovozyma castellii CBS 4309]
MNVSPTPKRYISGTFNPRRVPEPEYNNYHHNYNNHNYQRDNLPRYDDVKRPYQDHLDDALLPDDAKRSNKTFDELVRHNRHLKERLEGKQQEVEKLTILSTSLKEKLIKYTTLTANSNDEIEILKRRIEDLEKENKRLRRRDELFNEKIKEEDSDKKVFTETTEDDELLEKIEKLTAMILKHKQEQRNSGTTPAKTSWKEQNSKAYPTEETLLTQESLELKSLEDQVEKIRHKLALKRENEQRKISLNKELLKLKSSLEPSLSTFSASLNSSSPSKASPLLFKDRHSHHPTIDIIDNDDIITPFKERQLSEPGVNLNVKTPRAKTGSTEEKGWHT